MEPWPTAALACPACRRESTVPCQELAEAKSQISAYRRLLGQSGLACFELDGNGVVRSWNGTIAEVFGLREQEAVGHYLEDLVGDRYRARVTHALSRAQRPSAERTLGLLPLAGRGASESSEVTFRTVTHVTSQGQFAGALALAQPVLDAAAAPKVLPTPVAGVSAWRCTLRAVGAAPPQFELRQMDTPSKDAPCSDAEFPRQVERAVRAAAKVAVSSSSSKLAGGWVPFEAEQLLCCESQGGGRRFYSVRGAAARGPDMPFGGGLELGEGYVVDVTAMKSEQQEAVKWQERWRSLAQMAFDFTLLVDITEYRILKSWGDTSVLGAPGASIEGRSLFEFVPRDDRSRIVDGFGAAMAATGGAHVQDLPFRHRFDESKEMTGQCTIISDSGDPSLVFFGARLRRAAEPAAAPELAKEAKAEAPAKAGAAPRTGPRLTAAALGLFAGFPGPPPGMGRERELQKEPVRPAPIRPAPGGSKPPAPEAPAQAQAGGQGAAAPSPTAKGREGRRKPRSVAASSHSSRMSPRHAPRVIPTFLLLQDEEGQELWRSAELLLGQHLRAKELLTCDSAPRFNMPQQFADLMLNNTHELFVLDDGTGESLQIADLASTSLMSLQRHCNPAGQLTMIISPAEGSEDAFETVPATR